MSLCKYKDIFGAPNTGAHRYRIFNIAIVDVLVTLIGAYVISLYVSYTFTTVAIIVFIAGIIAHRLFCVRTTVDKFLFS
jgi:hypothetical protein